MKNIAIFACIVLVLCTLPTDVLAAQNTEDIIILYENDVHCAIEGYSKLAAMKKELQETYAYVGAVSGGDYIQGNGIGMVSQGAYIIDLMNLVGYDAITLGNHEFDYGLERLDELIGMMDTKPVCCNFRKIDEDGPYYEPYAVVSYGDTEIAYIGITTPTTITSSFPVQFKDENDELIYTFEPTTLYDIVQYNIDSARSSGADYVIALAHIGDYGGANADIEDLIRNTDGLDVVLDAHSHSVIESKKIIDEGGNEVLLSSAGTKFEYIGKLTVSQDGFKTELIKTDDCRSTDPTVDSYIRQIYSEYAELGKRSVAFSEVDLIEQDSDGNRLVRRAETNLGDLCADAFRSTVNADIGYINGGGIRAGISAGEITCDDLLGVLPFNNKIVLAEVSGQTVKDMLEMTMRSWPEENGNFPHLSGVTFSINTAVPSSVVLNEQNEFAGISGQYRVYDIKVFNNETGAYEPIDLTDTYTIASQNYTLLELGGGMKMFENAKILINDGPLDTEALERYMKDELNGVVGEQYRETTPNITFTDGGPDSSDDMRPGIWLIGVASGFVLALLAVFLIKKRRRPPAADY